MELPGRRVCVDLGVAEAAHARPDEAGMDAEVEHRRAAGLRQLELHRGRRRDGLVPLPAEQERLQLDVEPLLPHLARPKPQPTEVESLHGESVAPGAERFPY